MSQSNAGSCSACYTTSGKSFRFQSGKLTVRKALIPLLLFLTVISFSNNAFSQRPNFIIIVLDDAHEPSLPPEGPSFLHYPSIERIYNEGLRVCDAYCLMPLCAPARYSLFTGTYPHTHGCISDGTPVRADLPTFFSATASHGYHNAYVGKYSNIEDANLPGIQKTLTITRIVQNNPKMKLNGVVKPIPGNTTVIIDDTSSAWLATIDTPFVFGIGHIGTHSPIPGVSPYTNDYNGLATLPDNYFPYTVDYPSYLYTDTTSNGYLLAHDSVGLKNLREKLYEIQSEINRGIENIFSVLQSRGILDNTMIIFTNDNGFSYGEHQLSGKQDATEPSASVPLFIRYPAWFPAGTFSCGNMIGLHDIGPTILDAAGIDPAPYHFQGQSLHDLLQPGNERTSIYLEDIKKINPNSQTGIDSAGEPSWRAVRTLGFKYVKHRCQSQVEELFDLTTDPEENTNQVNNASYSDTLNYLRHLLDSLAITTVDTLSGDTVYLPCTLISCIPSTFFADNDADGYGNANATISACVPPSGYLSNSSDCNDANATIHPGATDACNGVDDDCDGIIDEGCSSGVITTGTISGSPFCPAAVVSVPFTSSGTFNGGNVYTAQLSNKKGSFSTPTAIGTLNSTANSGAITATIPTKPQAGTNYRIRVVSTNPVITGTNNGSNIQLVACGTVTGLSVSSITTTSASINWTGVSCAAKYKVQYRKQGVTTWTTKYSTSNSYSVTGLLANTTYEYQVQTFCTESGSSKSSATAAQTFTTSLRVASGFASAKQTMSMHPNPAVEQTTIQYSLSKTSHIYFKLYDLSGQEIKILFDGTADSGDHSLLITTGQFQKGIYLVRMISDLGIENQKLIIQ